MKSSFQRKTLETLVLQNFPSLRYTYVPQGNLLRPQDPRVVESWHYVSIYSTFWGIANLSRVDVILVSSHMAPCSVHWVSDWLQIRRAFLFHIDGLNSRPSCQKSYWNPDFWGYGSRPYSALFKLVFDTHVTSFSWTLDMPHLFLNAHSWCVGWYTILFGRIMLLLGPYVAWWAPLESLPLSILHAGVTTYFLLVRLWYSPPLNIDNFFEVTII